jgi:molybdenum cofactor guanylyltransferase
MKIAGCILAGGRSSRFGSDKALVTLGGKTLLEHAIERLRPQVSRMVINSNSNADEYRIAGLPIVGDFTQDFDGPLAGVYACLHWAGLNGVEALVTIAVDTPLFPLDLVARLLSANETGIVVAESPAGLHPTFALWPVSLEPALQIWLSSGQSRRMTDFFARQTFKKVSFEANGGLDPFFNINTPQDLRIVSTQNVGRLSK